MREFRVHLRASVDPVTTVSTKTTYRPPGRWSTCTTGRPIRLAYYRPPCFRPSVPVFPYPPPLSSVPESESNSADFRHRNHSSPWKPCSNLNDSPTHDNYPQFPRSGCPVQIHPIAAVALTVPDWQ